MATILFNSIVFGPIKSRRLGNSLGVNLLPKFGKICNFDCVYCECGWNKDGRKDKTLPTKKEVFEALETSLINFKKEGTSIDTITFSGNGEPTLHPDFCEIIDFTIELRNSIFPDAAISVLSNATMIGRKEIREALLKIDNPIFKIDSADEDIIKLIDNPVGEYSLAKTIENLSHFNGNYILQTMFLKGVIDGKIIDCTAPEIANKWIELVLRLKPREVMMYTIDRETPSADLEKVSAEKMREIAKPLIEKGFIIKISE